MMNKLEWLEAVKEEVIAYIPKDFPVDKIDVVCIAKNNNETLSGISITTKDPGLCPIMYLEKTYEEYVNGKDMETILFELADEISNLKRPDVDVRVFSDFNIAKKLLSARMCSFNANMTRLSDKLYDVIGDFAKCYCLTVTQSENEIGSCLITDGLFEQWNVTKEEVREATDKNLEANATLYDMVSVAGGMLAGLPLHNLLEEEKEIEETSDMYVLSNISGAHGAASFLSSKIREKVYNLIGSFYVLPSSIHELVIIPQKNNEVDIEHLKEVVLDANKNIVSKEEWLSDNIYLFDGKEICCIA